MRDYNVQQLAKNVTSCDDALKLVDNLRGTESIFGSRDRIAMPDETLYFGTGTDRDKAVLLFTLLRRSPIADPLSTIHLSGNQIYVRHREKQIGTHGLNSGIS